MRKILLLWLLCHCCLYAQAKKVWMWESPLPQGNTLDAVWGTSRDDVFAVGRNGAILHFDGNRWQEMVSSTFERFSDVWGNASDDVFAVGFNGIIMHFDGNEWSPMESPTSSDLRAVWGDASDNIFAVGSPTVVLHFDGNEWSVMNAPSSEGGYFALWGNASDNIYATGFGGAIIHFDGNEWTSFASPPPTQSSIFAIHGIENFTDETSDDIYISAENKVFHFDGNQWNEIVALSNQATRNLWVHSNDNVFIVGQNGIILHFDGNSVVFMDSPTKDFLFGIWGDSNGETFAVGENGATIHFDLLNWSSMNFSLTIDGPTGIWANSENDIFMITNKGKLLHYNGEQWSVVGSVNNALRDIWGFSNQDIFISGTGAIFHYNGNELSSMNCPTSEALNSIWGTANNDVFTVGEGVILHFDGSSWTQMSAPITISNRLAGVWGSSSDNVFAVGGGTSVMHFDGNEWKEIDANSAHGRAIWGTSENDVFIVGGQGQIFHFDGNEWSQMESTVEGGNVRLESVSGSASDNVFAVGRGGQETIIVHFDGNKWNRMDFRSTVSLMSVFAEVENSIIAVGGVSTILRLRNPALQAPDSLRVADVTTDQVVLNWRDNSMGEQGFIIERKDGEREEFQEVGTVGFNVTDFPNTGLTPFTKYFYRLKSFTDDGQSNISNVRSVITAVAEMMRVDSLKGKINKDQQSASISVQMSLNNIDNSFIPRQDSLRLTIQDSQGTSYEIFALGINFSQKGKKSGVFSIKNKVKGITGSVNANIDGSSKTTLQIKSSQVPISLFRDQDNLSVQLKWGAFDETVEIIADRKGDSFSYSSKKNTQVTKDLYFNSISAKVSLIKDNADSLQVNLSFPGDGENYNPAVDPLRLTIGGFTVDVEAGTLQQKGTQIKGTFAVGDSGKAAIVIDLAKHTLLFKANKISLRDALEETIITGLQLGSFEENRVVTLTRKDSTTQASFSYK